MLHPHIAKLEQMLKNFGFDFQSARTMPARAQNKYTLVYDLVDQLCVKPVTRGALPQFEI